MVIRQQGDIVNWVPSPFTPLPKEIRQLCSSTMRSVNFLAVWKAFSGGLGGEGGEAFLGIMLLNIHRGK